MLLAVLETPAFVAVVVEATVVVAFVFSVVGTTKKC